MKRKLKKGILVYKRNILDPNLIVIGIRGKNSGNYIYIEYPVQARIYQNGSFVFVANPASPQLVHIDKIRVYNNTMPDYIG